MLLLCLSCNETGKTESIIKGRFPNSSSNVKGLPVLKSLKRHGQPPSNHASIEEEDGAAVQMQEQASSSVVKHKEEAVGATAADEDEESVIFV